MVDEVSLTVANASLGAAAAAVVVAVLTWRESRKQRKLAEEQRKLTEVMVESLGYLAKSMKPTSDRPRRARTQVGPRPSTTSTQSAPAQATRAVAPSPAPVQVVQTGRAPTPAQQARIALETRREERRRLELELRQQREQWKRQKDIAKAIGWVLDRIGSDEEDDEDE